MATTWGYLPNTGDRRLASISNVGLVAGQHSTYQYTTTPEDFITAIAETSDTSAVYPSPGTQTASYNNLNQLTNLSGQTLTWDADGNLLSDGQRNYSWDAENRLIGITYPAQPGKATSFAYDGLSRRTSISSTPPGGGSAVTLSYLWCGSKICQARDSGNNVTREYYSEGELVPGTPAQIFFYGPDQIGSVRRVFESAISAPAYSYDPYGNALQTAAPATDFGYAGMFYNADSGLYLTQYRAYDPVAGRWLSRDPVGEASDPDANLYSYVADNPSGFIDSQGLIPLPPTVLRGDGALPPTPSSDSCDNMNGQQNPNIILAGGRKGKWRSGPPTFQCPWCGAPHAGGEYSGSYCPECEKKSKDPEGGVPPNPNAPKPEQYAPLMILIIILSTVLSPI